MEQGVLVWKVRAPGKLGHKGLEEKGKPWYRVLREVINGVPSDRKYSCVLRFRVSLHSFLSPFPDGKLLDDILFIFDSTKDLRNIDQTGAWLQLPVYLQYSDH